MNESHVNGTKQVYAKLNNAIQFRFRRIKERQNFFIAEIKGGGKISKKIKKTLNYTERALLSLVQVLLV